MDENDLETGVEPKLLISALDMDLSALTREIRAFHGLPVPAHIITKVKGDQHCATVAAAAVIAKVTRDHLMVDIAKGNPAYEPYGWARNKGYGSQVHRDAIAKYGPTPLHRLSWHLV